MHQAGRDEQVVVGQQGASQAGRRPAQGKGRQLDAVDRVAHGFHARLVLADTLQGRAEARGHHAAEPPHEQREQHQHQVIEADVMGQIDARQRGIARQVQPVFAAVLAQRDKDVEQHLRERQRDHDEVHAAGAQRNRPPPT
ncbi:hypothetical protein G6F31_019305 [Rhizopus arrhizus]|nr:hypothetical protein G6F31_019305 [Rhizopus arrhizus]